MGHHEGSGRLERGRGRRGGSGAGGGRTRPHAPGAVERPSENRIREALALGDGGHTVTIERRDERDLLGSAKEVDCVFHSSRGRHESYVGTIRKLGVEHLLRLVAPRHASEPIEAEAGAA